jgi:adenylate kinase
MNILMLGPQGSGKGTQAKLISAHYGVPHIATGDMLREAIANGSELGRRVEPILERGELVPDELMISLIQDRLSRPDAADGFVLDGFPRTMAQAGALDAMLRGLGRVLTIIFELQLSDEDAVARLLRRAQLEGRADDAPDAIKTRLQGYHEETEPVIEHYRATGNLVGIHADRSIPDVFKEIQAALDHLAVRTR